MKPFIRLSSVALFCLLSACANQPAPITTISADNNAIYWSGRHVSDSGTVRFGYPSVSANMTVSSGTLKVHAWSSKDGSWLAVNVDGEQTQRIALSTTPTTYTLLDNSSGTHEVKISHVSETWRGIVSMEYLELHNGQFLAPPNPPVTKLMVIGDSVTCGEGVFSPVPGKCKKHPRQPDSDHSYGMLLGQKLDAETQLICYGGRGVIRSWNGRTDELQAPKFFELTIPEPGEARQNLSDFSPDVIVISLGTNDFSLGIGPLPAQSEFVGAYSQFVDRLLNVYPRAILALTEGSIVNDEADPARPQKTLLKRYIAQTVAQTDSARVYQLDSPYFPGDECDAHPTGAQHTQMAEQLWRQLAPIIERHQAIN